VILDSQLNMRDHISEVASTCFFHLRWLCELHRVVAPDVKQRLVSALVLSRVDYCNSSLAAVALAPLQRVFNAATRYVTDLRLGLRDHVTSVQRSLHWLPVHQRIEYKLGVLMYVIVNGTAPDYISSSATLTSAMPGRLHLWSAGSLTFDIPRTCTRSQSLVHGHGTNFHRTSANRLALSLLRKKLKTHLFATAYNHL